MEISIIMNDEKKKKIKSILKKEIKKTKESIASYEEMTQPISPENSIGRVSRMDAINNKSVQESALRSARKKLGQLQAQLTKVGNDRFGLCSRCGKLIQEMRIIKLPESSYCVHCAR